MKYRQLGNSGLTVSEIGLGCSGYWGKKQFDQSIAIKIVHEAFDRGVNLFDTGHNYSNFNAEPRLGIAIRDLLAVHDRESLIISSKAGSLGAFSPFQRIKSSPTQNFSPNYIESSCLSSISNLGCDYLDIFQLHGISPEQLTPQLLDKLFDLKERGVFRTLGINSHNSNTLNYVSQHPEIFDLVLLDYNVLQLDREPLIDKLVHSGVAVLAGTILAQGHLVSKKIDHFVLDLFFGT